MTLGEGKRKVLMLLDEYSTGGVESSDPDISLKMADFFDMAQKDVAKHSPIRRTVEKTLTEKGIVQLPRNCADVLRVWRNGSLTRSFTVIDGGVLLSAGQYVLEYRAVPDTIHKGTPDDYEFQLREEACACLPYFVAAHQLITDLVVDYGAFWNIYKTMLAELNESEPQSGASAVRQSFFRNRRA